jgi:hypothetical protein
MHIRIARLESRKWTCTLSAGPNASLSLDGCTIKFVVKRTWKDASALFELNSNTMGISFVDTASGIYELTIHSTATQSVSESGKNENYVFDHRILLANGTVKVLESGDFVVTPGAAEF